MAGSFVVCVCECTWGHVQACVSSWKFLSVRVWGNVGGAGCRRPWEPWEQDSAGERGGSAGCARVHVSVLALGVAGGQKG